MVKHTKGRPSSSIIAFMVFIGLLLGSFAHAEEAALNQTGPSNWTVMVGEEADSSAWQFLKFYPQNITIHAGDTVIWKLGGRLPHTVIFPKVGENATLGQIVDDSQEAIFNILPLLLPQGSNIYDGSAIASSGQMGPDPELPQEYRLTFPKEGAYEYFCAFHNQMKGRVMVLSQNITLPQTQDEIDIQTAAELAEDVKWSSTHQPSLDVATRPGPNGTTVYEAGIGYGDGYVAWMRFFPTTLVIYVGDTVEWYQNDWETIHTVTFTSGEEIPEAIQKESQKKGPAKLVLNPKAMEPAGGSVYSGQGYFNSGFLLGTNASQDGPRNYSLTFESPGAYEYKCLLHHQLGMRAMVIVLPKEDKPQPKTEGDSQSTIQRKTFLRRPSSMIKQWYYFTRPPGTYLP